MAKHVCECEHKNIKATLAASTSVMAVVFQLFGFECEDCPKRWDIGNAMEAIRATERLSVEDTKDASICVALAIGWLDSGMKNKAKECIANLESYTNILEGK